MLQSEGVRQRCLIISNCVTAATTTPASYQRRTSLTSNAQLLSQGIAIASTKLSCANKHSTYAAGPARLRVSQSARPYSRDPHGIPLSNALCARRVDRPAEPSVHFQLASLPLICTRSNLAESARCYASFAGLSKGCLPPPPPPPPARKK